MDRFVNQFSEIGKLNAVMLHRPGDELNQVTPDFFDDMLIDDTLYLPAAQPLCRNLTRKRRSRILS